MKKISTKTHGIIDYASAISLFALPRLMRWNARTTQVLTGSAILTALYSMLTKYELGVFKILPMKAHLGLDAAQSTALATAPFFFANGRRSIMASMLGLSVIEALITLNTQSRPRRKFLWFNF